MYIPAHDSTKNYLDDERRILVEISLAMLFALRHV